MPGNFLNDVLDQSQHIHELIRRSTEQLPAGESAVDTTATVRSLLEEASRSLTAVNQTLQAAIRDRTLVDYRLAAAVEQELGARNAALHDNLTGLPNRVLFQDRLEHAIAHAKRHRLLLAVMFVDLDNFKAINDTYGHQTGDAVLKTVATRLSHSVRTDDTVSRYGGDEFLCLVAQLHDQKDIAMIAAKILKAIQAPCDILVGDEIVHLALDASIGISMFPKDGASALGLISAADAAMYEVKREGSALAFRKSPVG